jgi:hypothetical protein
VEVESDAEARLNEVIEWTTVLVHEIDGILIQDGWRKVGPLWERMMRHVVTAQADLEALIRKL